MDRLYVPPRLVGFGYDYGLGIDPHHIDYIMQSHIIQSRISPTPCYLLQLATGGVPIGYPAAQITPLANQYYQDANGNWRLVIWEGGSNRPDSRPYVNGGVGNIYVNITTSPGVTVGGTRVISPADLTANNEFAVVERKDIVPVKMDIVFNPGFYPVGNITYHYLTWNEGLGDVTFERGDSTSQSIFGWDQYISSYVDDMQQQNQILVRFPINIHDIVISDEGKVIVESRDSWMIWTPYVNDFDVLILAAEDAPDGEEHRYEIVNSQDSIIQRRLVSQRFKLNLLERADERYNIPYVKYA